MKISTAVVCDVHHVTLDRHVHTFVLKGELPVGKRDTLRCQYPICDQYYTPDRGYFSAKAGDRPADPIPATLRCRQHNEHVFMYREGVLCLRTHHTSQSSPGSSFGNRDRYR